jgi:CrcB protein
MVDVMLVGLGGFFGSALRYLMSKALDVLMPTFPLGTLVVNAASSLVAGMLLAIACGGGLLSERARLFASVGFCGGLSTFSAFSAETLVLIQKHDYLTAGANAALNVAVSLICVGVGFQIVTLCADSLVR